MSVGGMDFELNGVKYNAAEDAEGEHYVLSAEPLRPPNAVTVQGENSQKFQMRPDVLLWTLTDWSGGEGQYKFDPQNPHRHWKLTGVRVFERPGVLQPGYYIEDTSNSGGVWSADAGLIVAIGKLYAINYNSGTWYEWDSGTKLWGSGTALTGVTNGPVERMTGDATALYFVEQATNKVWKFTGANPPTTISTSVATDDSQYLAEEGSYVYAHEPAQGRTWEILKSGAGTTQIDSFQKGIVTGGIKPRQAITAMDGKVYTMVTDLQKTSIREITPSSAAGTGFAAEIARIHGFRGESLWSHSGLLYVAGTYNKAEDTTVLYLAPGGEYGSLGVIRQGEDLVNIAGQEQGTRMLDHFFVAEQTDDNDYHHLFQIDAISGGMAVLGINEEGGSNSGAAQLPVVFEGDIFFPTDRAASPRRIMRAYSGGYTKTSSAISPWHDFDLAEEKILSSLVLSCEALPASWTVYVDYKKDGAAAWTNVITYSTTSGTGTKAAVSTDSSTVKFRSVQVRIRMVYGGAGVPTSGPVIQGVDVRAMVVKPQKVWRLLLDCSDSKSGPQGHSGAVKIANIETAGDSENVIDFKDGYQSNTPGTYEQHDVVVDSYNIILSTPGEGVAQVVLREVV